MDSKAQASSVFQLLISAIVAGAVLMILLQVLGVINFGFNQAPDTAAADQLKDAWNHRATIKTTTSNVTFTSAASNINSVALADSSKVGISKEQICLSLGDFSTIDNPPFEINDDRTSITYTGSSNKDARVSVYCYTGKELQSTLEGLGTGLDPAWAGECACADSEETCCLVALRFEKRG